MTISRLTNYAYISTIDANMKLTRHLHHHDQIINLPDWKAG